jgi:gliding motility-associated-like protein
LIRSILLILTVFLALPFCAEAQAPVPVFSSDVVEGCSPLVVSFTDQSTGAPTAWYWEFGNGATSTLKNPSTTFFEPGTYTITLTVTNANGSNTVTKANYITVYGKPEVSFSVPDSTGCYPFPVQISDNSTASPGTVNTAWVWDLGDGTQSTEQNPTIVYQNDGDYTVSLKVTNNKGCWGVATKHGYIQINGTVKAGFNFQPPVSCQAPFVVSFQNTSTGPGQLSYTWDFGDGDTATEASPNHSYTSNGLYSVTLIATSSEGCADTLRQSELVNLQTTATSFSAPDVACVGDTVLFSNTSPVLASTTAWTFGDGTTSNELSPVKIFTTPGTYTIKLQQTYGTCSDIISKTIQVFAKPAAAFTADTTADCQPPLTVRFTNSSTGATSYLWNFGDSTTSTEENPVHTYTSYGTFPVTLLVTNASGCTDSFRLSRSIFINKPQITFTSLPVSGCVPLAVTFEATVDAPAPVTSYAWDFGNGVTSTEIKPSFTYTEPGTYAVTLTVATASGCTETYVMERAVTIGRKPSPSFSAEPTTVCALQPVQFTNTSVQAGSFTWLFGDGGTSTEQNPLYQYIDTGTFDIKLIADNNGCRDTLTLADYITIKPPIARFAVRPSCTNKLFYTFTDQSIGAQTWQWDFGDGSTTSGEQNPTHTYRAYGIYTVTLTVTSDSCIHIKKTEVRVVNGTPDFTIAPPAACKGTPVLFSADTTNIANIVSYTWNFGFGGPQGYGLSTSAIYPRSGTYNVSLVVRDVNGCEDSTVKKQAVRMNGPTAGIKAQNNNGCKGLIATFSDASKDDGTAKILNWEWNLGDGTTVKQTALSPVQHRYEKAGSYDVRLKVTDAGGCADSLLLPGLVQTKDIIADFVSADTVSCPGATVRFSNTSKTATPYTSFWTFGDGKTARQQQPSTTYSADGLYSVQLRIVDADGCTDSIQRNNYIFIKHPVAAFTVNDSASTCVPFQVQYTNTSSHYTQHVWDLSGGTSRLLNPTQYYNTAGIYQTKLIVTSPGGCTDTATKTISVYDIAASKIDYLPVNGCKPLTVNLTATTPVKMDFIWDFGDGTILSSRDTARQHVYNYFGDFVPKIIMKNSGGCVVAITGQDTIRIKGATAKYGINNRLFCDSGTVHFTDSTTFNNPITGYNWNFGDGTTSTTPSPSHLYTKPGLYNVSLSVQTENRCVDTFRLQYPIKVVASPAIRIAGDSVICAGGGIVHRGLFERSDTSAVQWAWSFPNGNQSAIQSPPKQVYETAGRFRVQTVAVNSSGCHDTAWQNIVVNPVPSVTLPSVITTMVGTPVTIPAIYSNDIRNYQWTVPEGLSCTDCPQPVASPKFNTNYSVLFTDNNGCRNRGTVQVIVLCNNDNVFLPNTFSPNGDGSNDVFFVRGKGLSRVKMLRIFNRWGQIVFERANFNVNDASAGWDGTFKGAKAAPDVYVYQAEIFCDNSQVVKFEGNVALIQ